MNNSINSRFELLYLIKICAMFREFDPLLNICRCFRDLVKISVFLYWSLEVVKPNSHIGSLNWHAISSHPSDRSRVVRGAPFFGWVAAKVSPLSRERVRRYVGASEVLSSPTRSSNTCKINAVESWKFSPKNLVSYILRLEMINLASMCSSEGCGGHETV